ncbi:BolA family transcriptional regulator [Sorangium cellulosum]|uniref:BolA family transcriptional regulator n=1 Tax=Sorangium cellulosum TaxID=56 RepID=A0A2L0EU34_SORCE|nr:BolA family protein [Sorangium cellulosum]AUX42794.1 BolA family transcriptional regulator [Sorangium cellulosum]
MTTKQESIQNKLRALEPVHLDVENESRMHSVPAGSETHFKVLVVSEAFRGLGPVDRHRRVNELLREEFLSGLHALTIRAMTPDEWERQGAAGFQSPACLGGSKAPSGSGAASR